MMKCAPASTLCTTSWISLAGSASSIGSSLNSWFMKRPVVLLSVIASLAPAMPRSFGGRSSRDSGSGSSRNSRASTMGMTTWLGSGASAFAASAWGASAAGAAGTAGAAASAGLGSAGGGASCARPNAGLNAMIAASRPMSTAPRRLTEVGTLPRERCLASPVAIKLFSSWLPGPLGLRGCTFKVSPGGLLLCCSKRVWGAPLVKVSRFYSRTCDPCCATTWQQPPCNCPPVRHT